MLDEADRTREFSPFVVRILMERGNAISYQAVGTVKFSGGKLRARKGYV